jgi:ABC-type nitrate/sulfonate/bicarbonate transport system permease component
VIYALPVLWWWGARILDQPRAAVRWLVFGAMLIWWIVVFRISPEGDGFMTTTWQSLLRIFAATLLAATVSVLAAASSDRSPARRRPQ